MGRYLTGTDAASAGGTMRSERHVLTSSNPALPVPSWAKLARITGIGGGGGGSVQVGTTGGVASGGCAGIAYGAVLPLGGAATIGVEIGAGGAGAAAGASASGGAGGDTIITAGGLVMVLEGGASGARGRAYMGTTSPANGYNDLQAAAGLMVGYYMDALSDGSPSPFGGGGLAATGSTGDGADATGYGAGGGGSHGGRGGNGSPGLAIIEFLEAM